MRYTESTLQNWTKPASETEDQKINNTINMIYSAINSCRELDECDIEIFAQGSYANNTNVRMSSDVDVCVMLKSTFYAEYPEGKGRSDYGFTQGSISFDEYKERVKSAIIRKFGSASVSVGNKSIKVRSNSYHVNADVVVAFMLKNYQAINSCDPEQYVEGIRFYALDHSCVTNYPKQHIKNGREKNVQTSYNYKKLVRIFKRIRNEMVDAGIIDKNTISSFLTECLIWNVPNSIIVSYSSWTETIKQSILYLYNAIENNQHSGWREVSEYLHLFHSSRKWTDRDVQLFLESMWTFLELE